MVGAHEIYDFCILAKHWFLSTVAATKRSPKSIQIHTDACAKCESINIVLNGRNRYGNQQYFNKRTNSAPLSRTEQDARHSARATGVTRRVGICARF
jgi:hypothetical protein